MFTVVWPRLITQKGCLITTAHYSHSGRRVELCGSLWNEMGAILGAEAVNEGKLISWRTRVKVLGHVFDTVAETVVISKIAKTGSCIAYRTAKSSSHGARACHLKNRQDRILHRISHRLSQLLGLRSLLGRLRHVVTCVHLVRSYIQRLRQQECTVHRLQRCPSILLWGTPQDVIVDTDASDTDLCALMQVSKHVLWYAFRSDERDRIGSSKNQSHMGNDINYELLSGVFAVYTWNSSWSVAPTHVHV
ncbi:hypothetical protein PHMEG_0008091 [Phytophthora megakarya]|uniref:Reverse transcriptase n=1 Tax=Phytophthora megakarya TaxID=4795 RepID=A0A225WJL0_9STRA|nr:hypothetical protein PHMEG_0008091 [Phytophthora megakarya]